MSQVGNIGTVFTATVKDGGVVVNLTGATPIDFLFNPPGGAIKSKTGTIVSASAGTVQYTTIAGDLDTPGAWTLQVKITTSGGDVFYSGLHKFTVGGQLA